MKKYLNLMILLICCSCAELQDVVNQLPQSNEPIATTDIASALKQALNLGIEKQVSTLAKTDGFFKNELVKILLPEELKQLDDGLRKVGLGNLADEGLKVLNRAAEDAVKEATPIFVNAVKAISFDDAKRILLGDKDAATQYLISKTRISLYNKFKPVIKQSFAKVGADDIWTNLITRYNNIPFTTDVNPDLNDYVTQEALNGVYTMIELEERNIRGKVSARTTDLLRRVFALQD